MVFSSNNNIDKTSYLGTSICIITYKYSQIGHSSIKLIHSLTLIYKNGNIIVCCTFGKMLEVMNILACNRRLGNNIGNCLRFSRDYNCDRTNLNWDTFFLIKHTNSYKNLFKHYRNDNTEILADSGEYISLLCFLCLPFFFRPMGKCSKLSTVFQITAVIAKTVYRLA